MLKPSLLSAEELLVLIPNIILISVSSADRLVTYIRLRLVIYTYIFTDLEVDLHVFSQLAWLSSSTRNFRLCIQFCFDFAMHNGAFIVPLSVNI